MSQHIVTGAGAPLVAPPSIGAHYTDLTSKQEYIAFGTLTAEDWVLQEKGGTAAAAVAAHVADAVPHTQYVQKDGAKQLSTEDYTTAEKAKLAGLESSHFKGLHVDLAALIAAVPAPVDGDYADVDTGLGAEVVRHVWDSSDSEWKPQLGQSAQLTAAQIKSEYESNPNTNAYTDAEKTKLAGLESSHFKGLFVDLAALTAAVPAPVDGDYADVDAGIGSEVVRHLWDSSDAAWVPQLGASAQLTAAQVKSEYESNPDTNAFTDAEKTKLAGLQNGLAVGDVLLTLRDPGASHVAPGSTQLQATYPELFALIGLTGGSGPSDGASWGGNLYPAGAAAMDVVRVANDGTNTFMAVEYKGGEIFRSTDDGATWALLTGFGANDWAYSIAGDGTGVWIVTGDAGFYRTTDNGNTWAFTANPVSAKPALCIDTDRAGVWMAGGSGGTMYRSADNGVTWGTVTSGFSLTKITDIATDMAGNWVATGWAGKMSRSVNNGASWSLVMYPSGVPNLSWVSTNTIGKWIAGGADNGTGPWAVSIDNGATWTYKDALLMVGRMQGSANGKWVGAGASIFHSADDGDTWTSVASEMVGDIAVHGAQWVATGYAKILRSGDLYPYNAATEFLVPEVTAPVGATAYIKATA
ncbi:hypothetical protein SAMN05216229_102122 [Geopseudomonas sagittaria]|uniref:Uncharacterized protein n=1 Tax=Geopseudomonas sagittaria TaxID=1135990 RepID=A0A1I5PZN1_9GAMM|nr:hypothetical protein [Pseudomonas sagittaria]SFP39528.1 hypothetical protein SAMN05216229_102122 [Pseudomonas sagittaria]